MGRMGRGRNKRKKADQRHGFLGPSIEEVRGQIEREFAKQSKVLDLFPRVDMSKAQAKVAELQQKYYDQSQVLPGDPPCPACGTPLRWEDDRAGDYRRIFCDCHQYMQTKIPLYVLAQQHAHTIDVLRDAIRQLDGIAMRNGLVNKTYRELREQDRLQRLEEERRQREEHFKRAMAEEDERLKAIKARKLEMQQWEPVDGTYPPDGDEDERQWVNPTQIEDALTNIGKGFTFPSSPWSAPGAVSPIQDIRRAAEMMKQTTGVEPRQLVVSPAMYKRFVAHFGDAGNEHVGAPFKVKGQVVGIVERVNPDGTIDVRLS